MEQFFAALLGFLDSHSFWVYLFIFAGKIIEVSISTLRVMLINRGQRVQGVVAAVFEYTLWLFVTGTAISNFYDDPLRIVVLIVAFAAGNYAGSWFEEKLALGLSTISVIMKSSEEAHAMADVLRDNGHAVTLMRAEGMSGQQREVLSLTVKRKFVHDVLRLIGSVNPSSMITVSNTASVSGGFLKIPSRKRTLSIHKFVKNLREDAGEGKDE